jgi:hypothetical protein
MEKVHLSTRLIDGVRVVCWRQSLCRLIQEHLLGPISHALDFGARISIFKRQRSMMDKQTPNTNYMRPVAQEPVRCLYIQQAFHKRFFVFQRGAKIVNLSNYISPSHNHNTFSYYAHGKINWDSILEWIQTTFKSYLLCCLIHHITIRLCRIHWRMHIWANMHVIYV